MRHHNVTEDTRDALLAELNTYGSDRAQQGKAEKAAAYAQAVHAIEAGALEVRVEHSVYRVVGEQRPARYATVEDRREQVLIELGGQRRFHAGHPKEGEVVQAIAAVGYGAIAVWADGVLYRVVVEG